MNSASGTRGFLRWPLTVLPLLNVRCFVHSAVLQWGQKRGIRLSHAAFTGIGSTAGLRVRCAREAFLSRRSVWFLSPSDVITAPQVGQMGRCLVTIRSPLTSTPLSLVGRGLPYGQRAVYTGCQVTATSQPSPNFAVSREMMP